MSEHTQSPNLTAIFIGTLLIVASFAFLLIVQLPALTAARAEEASKQAIHDSKQREISQLTAAKTTLALREGQLRSSGVEPEKLKAIIPVTEEVPSLYVQMEGQIGSASGLSNTSYQIGKPVQDPVDGVAKVPLTLTSSGNYSDLKTLIRKLEDNIRPLTITVLGFNQVGDSGQLTVSITGYFRSQTVTPTSVVVQ